MLKMSVFPPWLRENDAANWLLERLSEGDDGELTVEIGGTPALAG